MIPQYAVVLSEHGATTVQSILALTDDDFAKMKVKLIHKKKILRSASAMLMVKRVDNDSDPVLLIPMELAEKKNQ